MSSPMEAESVQQQMLEFARLVVRETCVRGANHAPSDNKERKQRDEGPVPPTRLDCVKEYGI